VRIKFFIHSILTNFAKKIQMNTAIEIMSPVGSWETLHAAIQGGADSVYFGVGHLNMRSRSTVNFTLKDIHKIMKICREAHVKAYVTVNTIIYDKELVDLQELIPVLSDAGVDAVIASDLAVIQECTIKRIPVHASTQLNISNIEAVRFFSQFCDVVVLARELSLQQVKHISTEIQDQQICGPTGNPVKIELFVHGALCMAVSGKCYLSLDNFNYSANRGACIQVCRRGYHVKDKDSEVELDIENEYIMSPKDLCTIDFLDAIVNAGVDVFKIEGRARPPEYVKTVTATYRKAAEAIKNGTYNKELSKQWKQNLEQVFNRGFWDGYYLGKKLGEWAEQGGSKASKIKEYVGKVTNYFSRINVFELTMESGEIASGDELLIIGPTTGVVELSVEEIRTKLIKAETAAKGDICSIPVNELVRRGDKVYKLNHVDDL